MPEVLFVCVHNAGRSQMAAALLRDRSGGRVDVRSAGSAPAEEVNPVAIEALREIGVEAGDVRPRRLEQADVQEADVVITMGCGDACPIYPGKRYEDWQVDDPARQPIEVVRRIRDDIDARVRALLATLRP
jgi:arsenate reductase (thioredoxin)